MYLPSNLKEFLSLRLDNFACCHHFFCFWRHQKPLQIVRAYLFDRVRLHFTCTQLRLPEWRTSQQVMQWRLPQYILSSWESFFKGHTFILAILLVMVYYSTFIGNPAKESCSVNAFHQWEISNVEFKAILLLLASNKHVFACCNVCFMSFPLILALYLDIERVDHGHLLDWQETWWQDSFSYWRHCWHWLGNRFGSCSERGFCDHYREKWRKGGELKRYYSLNVTFRDREWNRNWGGNHKIETYPSKD